MLRDRLGLTRWLGNKAAPANRFRLGIVRWLRCLGWGRWRLRGCGACWSLPGRLVVPRWRENEPAPTRRSGFRPARGFRSIGPRRCRRSACGASRNLRTPTAGARRWRGEPLPPHRLRFRPAPLQAAGKPAPEQGPQEQNRNQRHTAPKAHPQDDIHGVHSLFPSLSSIHTAGSISLSLFCCPEALTVPKIPSTYRGNTVAPLKVHWGQVLFWSRSALETSLTAAVRRNSRAPASRCVPLEEQERSEEAPPGSAGVPPACTPVGCRSVSLRCGARPPCRRERHGLGRSRVLAPLPVELSGGDGRGCANTCAGGTPALPGVIRQAFAVAAFEDALLPEKNPGGC